MQKVSSRHLILALLFFKCPRSGGIETTKTRTEHWGETHLPVSLPPPYFIVLASLVKTKEVEVIEFHRLTSAWDSELIYLSDLSYQRKQASFGGETTCVQDDNNSTISPCFLKIDISTAK